MSQPSLATASPSLREGLNNLRRSCWLPVVVVILLAIFFGMQASSFATLRNLTALSGEASGLLIACLGTSFVVLMGSIDLSVGAIVLLTGAISVTAMNSLGLGYAILPVAAAIGAILGLVNGIIYVFGGIPSFVVTLGSLSIFSGCALTILQGRAISYANYDFGNVAFGRALPHVPNIALWAIGSWLIAVLIGRHTRFGRYMYLIGGGETVARTAGVPVNRFKIYAFIISGFTAGLAGILLVARLGAAGPSLGTDLLLNTLAAVVVGGTSLAGGSGGPQRTLMGVLIITMLDNGLNLMRVSEYSQMIVKGMVVIGAVLVSKQNSIVQAVK